MKQQFYIGTLLMLGVFVKSQHSNVENNLTGGQVGLFGATLYHETKIAKNTTIRGDFGLNASVWGGMLYHEGDVMFGFYPAIGIQPKL